MRKEGLPLINLLQLGFVHLLCNCADPFAFDTPAQQLIICSAFVPPLSFEFQSLTLPSKLLFLTQSSLVRPYRPWCVSSDPSVTGFLLTLAGRGVVHGPGETHLDGVRTHQCTWTCASTGVHAQICGKSEECWSGDQSQSRLGSNLFLLSALLLLALADHFFSVRRAVRCPWRFGNPPLSAMIYPR